MSKNKHLNKIGYTYRACNIMHKKRTFKNTIFVFLHKMTFM